MSVDTALTAVTLALVAATLWLAFETRRMRFDAVRPLLVFTAKKLQNGQTALFVRNVGLGPATDLKLTVNGDSIEGFYAETDVDGLWGKTWRWTVVAAGQTLPAPTSGCIISLASWSRLMPSTDRC